MISVRFICPFSCAGFFFFPSVCYTSFLQISICRLNGEEMCKMTDAENVQTPKYRQLLDTLRGSILNGTYRVHDRIPSENELSAHFDVSRVTVRRALKELEEEGLLERRRGKGSFVSMPRIQRDLKMVTSFHASCEMMGLVASARVLSGCLISPDERDVKVLGCDPAGQVVEIRRLCLADDVPVMLEVNHFSPDYAWLLQEDLNVSLYGLLRSRRIEPDKAIHEISLWKSDQEDARWLGTGIGDALLRVVEAIYDQKGNPLHTSEQHVRGDRFTFRI